MGEGLPRLRDTSARRRARNGGRYEDPRNGACAENQELGWAGDREIYTTTGYNIDREKKNKQ